MPVLSDAEIARFAAGGGFSGSDLETAIAVALAESGGNSSNLGDLNIQTDVYGPSVGLWQIRSVNPGHGNQFDQQHRNADANLDPATNAANAHAIFEQHGWRPWTKYRNGDYKDFLDRARKAVEANGQQPAPTTPSTPAAGQQSGAAGGGDGMSAVLKELFSALPKLMQSGDRLGKVGQAAQQAAARKGAFGDVPGSRSAEAGNTRNAQRHAQHANGARKRVNQIGEDVNTSGKEYERQDQENAGDQKLEYLKIDNAYDPYRNMA